MASDAPIAAAPPRTSLRRAFDFLTVGLFLLAIAAPSIDEFVRPDSARSPEKPELRKPAAKPESPKTLNEFLAYTQAYEAWYKDHFGLRDLLLRWNSIVKLFVFRSSPSTEVFLGRDGWMFYTGEKSQENHRGALPWTPQQLERWARALENKRRILESMGIAYLYVVAPDKESVYTELLPASMRRIGPTRLEVWLGYMRENAPRVEVLDLRPALIAAKRQDAPDDWVYTNLGTHWNGRGSHVAARAIVERLTTLVPGFQPDDLSAYKRMDFGGAGDSWAPKMYVGDLLVQRIHGYLPPSRKARTVSETPFGYGRVFRTEIPDSTRPNLLMMHDSFGPHVEIALSEQCAYMECRWDTVLDVKTLTVAQPDVVVDLYVERSLNHIDPRTLVPREDNPWPRRFEMASQTLVGLDRAKDEWGLVPIGEVVIGPLAPGRRMRMPLTPWSEGDRVELGVLKPIEGELPVLHLALDSPVETAVSLWFKPEDQNKYLRQNAYHFKVEKGLNDLYLPLDRPQTRGEMRLRLGTPQVTYLLREFEIRSVEQP